MLLPPPPGPRPACRSLSSLLLRCKQAGRTAAAARAAFPSETWPQAERPNFCGRLPPPGPAQPSLFLTSSSRASPFPSRCIPYVDGAGRSLDPPSGKTRLLLTWPERHAQNIPDRPAPPARRFSNPRSSCPPRSSAACWLPPSPRRSPWSIAADRRTPLDLRKHAQPSLVWTGWPEEESKGEGKGLCVPGVGSGPHAMSVRPPTTRSRLQNSHCRRPTPCGLTAACTS